MIGMILKKIKENDRSYFL